MHCIATKNLQTRPPQFDIKLTSQSLLMRCSRVLPLYEDSRFAITGQRYVSHEAEQRIHTDIGLCCGAWGDPILACMHLARLGTFVHGPDQTEPASPLYAS